MVFLFRQLVCSLKIFHFSNCLRKQTSMFIQQLILCERHWLLLKLFYVKKTKQTVHIKLKGTENLFTL